MCNELFAYLAGAMDSDGSFGIKKNTYGVRVIKDAKNPTYSERVNLKQVTPDIPYLLKETFGGCLRLDSGGSKNSKPLYSYQATDTIAYRICVSLEPYLRIKKRQAQILMELRETKQGKYKQLAYWFAQEYPNWQEMDLITLEEATGILGYDNDQSVGQAIRNGTLLGLPYDYSGKSKPRIPALLVKQLAEIKRESKKSGLPPQLLQWKERLFDQVRELNKIGINGTPVYNRTGPYQPA